MPVQWMGTGPQRPSSWANHFLPGLAFSLWAFHWTVSVFRLYLTSSKNQPYVRYTTYPVPIIQQYAEPALKVLIPLFAILTQLWWAHGHWSSNICPGGTKRAGHFAIVNLHSWANAWTLFGFMAAGMVDVSALYLELPENLQHFMTAAAFGNQAFILYTSEFNDELDGMAYYCAFMSAALTAAAMLAELRLPDSMWAGVVKCYGLWLQAACYFIAARVLYEGRPAWDSMKPVPDMAPAAFVPVVYVMWMNLLSLGMLLVFLFMRWWYQAHLNEYLKSRCSVERTLVVGGSSNGTHPSEDVIGLPGRSGLPLSSKAIRAPGHGRDGKSAANHELVPLVSHHA